MTAGASQLTPLPGTSKYYARDDSESSRDSGANAVKANTPTVTTIKPLTRPKAPPRNRSTQRSPAPRIAQRTILAVAPARRTTARKIVKKAARSAIAGDFTYGKNHGAKRPYPQAASKYPTTVPANEITSKKKP